MPTDLSGKSLKRFRWVWLTIIFYLFNFCFSSCSTSNEDENSSIGRKRQELNHSFGELCVEWALDCAQEPWPRFPTDENPWEIEQWQAAFDIGNAFLSSGSQFEISRSDLSEEDLTTAVELVGLQAAYDKTVAILDEVTWSHLVISGENQAVQGYFQAANSRDFQSGLVVTADPFTSISFHSDGTTELLLSGFGLSAVSLEETYPLQSVGISIPDYFSVNIGQDSVLDVPMHFLVEQGLRDVIDAVPTEMPSDFDKLLPALGHLAHFVNKPNRIITLDSAFFDLVAQNLPLLLGDEEDLSDLYTLIESLDSLTTREPDDPPLLTALTKPQKKLECRMETTLLTAKMQFKNSFGINSVSKPTVNTVQLNPFGIRISLPILFGLSFDLTRMNIGPDSITIHNVPVVRKYEIKYKDLLAINCSTSE